jgi:hypothetical protein
MDKGVLGLSVTNVIIVGIVAIIFVMGYNYTRAKWFRNLPVA